MPILNVLLMIFWSIESPAETGFSKKTQELAAIQTQDRSIRKLESYLQSHPNDPRRAEFLIRLADLHLEKSGISFQYTEGESVRTQNKRYSQALQQAVRVLDQLIRDHAGKPMIAEAIFKRARAHKELGNIPYSKRGLLVLIQNHPGFEWVDSALLDLSVFAQDENQHGEAIQYLTRLQEMKDSPYHAIACRKAAWSRFNLGQYRLAMDQLEKEIRYYQLENKFPPEAESAWQDAALFSFEALNHRNEIKETKESIRWIERLCQLESKERMENCQTQSLVKFGKLLKAYQLGIELGILQDNLIRNYQSSPATLEISLLLTQFRMDKREYGEIPVILNETLKIKPETAKKLIRETIGELHSITAKNLKSNHIQDLLDPLDQLTRLYLGHTDEQDATGGDFRFAMAESAFGARKFELASHWYQDLLDHEKTIPVKWNSKSIRIRLVASKFEALKTLDPKDSKYKLELDKWITLALTLKGDRSIESESFQLEAMKSALMNLDRMESLNLLQDLSLNTTHDPIAREAASLVFDRKMKNNDSSQLLVPCQNQKWLRMEFLQSPCKIIVTKDLLSKGRLNEAEKMISGLSQIPAVTLLKIEILLKQGRLDQAISEQESWLAQTGWKDSILARSVFLHYWLNSKDKTKPFFRDQIRRQSIGESFLEPFLAALDLEESQKEYKWDPKRHQQRFKMSTHARKAASAIWSLSMLANPNRVPFQDRLVILQRIGANWDQVDPYLQIRYLPLLHSRIESTISSIRKNGSSIAPLRADESSVEKRVILLKDVDLTFGKVLKLDWLEIKIKTIRELNLVYQDFIADLRKAGTPENLIHPFISKTEELKAAETRLVSMILQPDRNYAKSSLLDQKLISRIPESIRKSWIKAVELGQADTLHYLILQTGELPIREELKGIILCALMPQVAGTEGMRLIQNRKVTP